MIAHIRSLFLSTSTLSLSILLTVIPFLPLRLLLPCADFRIDDLPLSTTIPFAFPLPLLSRLYRHGSSFSTPTRFQSLIPIHSFVYFLLLFSTFIFFLFIPRESFSLRFVFPKFPFFIV